MSAAQLLTELGALGVKVWPDAGALRFKAPAGAMQPELLDRLRAAKPELLAMLGGAGAANEGGEPAPDLPLLAAVNEFEALIERLCDLRQHPAAIRAQLRAASHRMMPARVSVELDAMRTLVGHLEAAERAIPADDRITCIACANRRSFDRVCKVASIGGVVNAVRGYVPDAEPSHRCAGFVPHLDAPDQRAGVDRWPGLAGGRINAGTHQVLNPVRTPVRTPYARAKREP